MSFSPVSRVVPPGGTAYLYLGGDSDYRYFNSVLLNGVPVPYDNWRASVTIPMAGRPEGPYEIFVFYESSEGGEQFTSRFWYGSNPQPLLVSVGEAIYGSVLGVSYTQVLDGQHVDAEIRHPDGSLLASGSATAPNPIRITVRNTQAGKNPAYSMGTVTLTVGGASAQAPIRIADPDSYWLHFSSAVIDPGTTRVNVVPNRYKGYDLHVASGVGATLLYSVDPYGNAITGWYLTEAGWMLAIDNLTRTLNLTVIATAPLITAAAPDEPNMGLPQLSMQVNVDGFIHDTGDTRAYAPGVKLVSVPAKVMVWGVVPFRLRWMYDYRNVTGLKWYDVTLLAVDLWTGDNTVEIRYMPAEENLLLETRSNGEVWLERNAPQPGSHLSAYRGSRGTRDPIHIDFVTVSGLAAVRSALDTYTAPTARIAVNGVCSSGVPKPSMLLEIYLDAVKIANKTIGPETLAFGKSNLLEVSTTAVGTHATYGRMVLSNALGSYPFLTATKTFTLG